MARRPVAKRKVRTKVRPAPELTGSAKRLQWYQQSLTLLRRAQVVRGMQARSYRDFRVGGAGLAYRQQSEQHDQFKIFGAGNSKSDADTPKHCAEMKIIEDAEKEGYTELVGILIIAEPQPDQGSGKLHPTLHPCEACRRVMIASMKRGGVIKPHTLIGMARPDLSATDEITVAELMAIHNEEY